MKRMLDLFCGRGGWTNAFLARGWECVGIDLFPQPEYRGTFIRGDVRAFFGLPGGYIRDERGQVYGPFQFGAASSPCEEFAVFGMANFHPSPPWPVFGIQLFEHAKKLLTDAGIPNVMENVNAAQKFVGKAVHKCGPFALWGNAVPPLMPQGITKGFGAWDRKYILTTGSSKSKKRRELKAKWATIPPELANCVADYAERITECQAK